MSSIKSQPDFKEKVLRYFKENGIPEHSRVLIGFSGGPDSNALLHVLVSLKERFPLSLTSAYMYHGIRPQEELEREFTFVKQICSSLNVKLVHERIAHGYLEKAAQSTGRSLEDVARQQRYSFFNDRADKLDCDFIALGHTEDDHIETLIMRFFQGVDITGLSGIPPKRENIIRPLFFCTRKEVLSYLNENHLRYVTDSTNLSTGYLRNSIRITLIPVVEDLFPGFRKSLVAFSRKMKHIKSFLENETTARLIWEELPAGFRIKGTVFLDAPGLIRVFSLFRLINILSKRIHRVPYRFLSPLLDDEFIQKRKTVLSGYGIRMRWKDDCLFIERDVVSYSKKGYLIVVERNRKYSMPKAGLIFKFGDEDGPGVEKRIQINFDSKNEPVILRSNRLGDRLRIKGGSKLIKKLLVEWKVPSAERWKVPILADRQGIVAVLGQPFGHRNRFRSGIAKAGLSMLRIDIENIFAEEM